MTRLLIARHGNTFGSSETPRRVGCRTDLPLVEKGYDQARALGLFLREKNMLPDLVFTGTLRRTMETAREAMNAARSQPLFRQETFLNEIDYGPDENKTEDEICARVGKEALKAWDELGSPAPGWIVSPERIIRDWQAFGHKLAREAPGGTVLAVTSNGIARFATVLTGDPEGFRREHPLKIATGAVCILLARDADGSLWTVEGWNVRPPIVS